MTQTFKYIIILTLSLAFHADCKGQRFIQALDSIGDPIINSFVYMQWDGEEAGITYFSNDKGEIELDKEGKGVFYLKAYGYHTLIDTMLASDVSKKIKLKKLAFYIPTTTITGGSDKESQAESVFSINVIKAKFLEETGRLNLRDALQNQLNIQLGEDNVLGSSLSMQGISGTGVKILMDGIPIIGRQNGNIDLSQIDVTNIERIEIIEGPMSVLYGADALGGVINIITKVPESGNTDFNISTYNDNFQHHNISGNLLSSLTKNLKVSFSGGRKFFKGYDFIDSTRSVDWKPKTQLFGDANVHLNFDKHRHRFRTRVYNDVITVRSNANNEIYTITGFNTFYFTKRRDLEYFSTFDLKNKAKFRVQSGYNLYQREKDEYRRDLVTGEENRMPAEFLDTTRFNQFQTKAYYFTNNKKKTNFMLGMESTFMSGNGTRIDGNGKKFNEIALFSSAVFNYKKLKINPGLRVLHQSQFGSDLGNSGIKLAPIIPTLHAKYKLNSKNNIRFSLASGYRAPDIKELYFYFVDRNHNILGNEDLQPEQSIHTDIKWDKRTSLGKNKMVSFSSGVFVNDVKNKIQLVSIGGVNNEFSYANLGDVKTLGGHGGVKYLSKFWSINIGVSTNGLKTTESDVKWNNQLIGSFTFTERLTRLVFNFSNKWNGASYGFNDDLTMFKVEQYNIADLSVSKKLFNKKIIFTTGVKNLWNVTNLQSTGNSALGHTSDLGNIPLGLGRTYFFNVNFALNHKNAKNKIEK